MLAGRPNDWHIRIVISHFGAARAEHFHQEITGRLTLIVNVGLVSQPQHEDRTALDRLLSIVQGIRQPVNYVTRHARINFAGKLDKASVLTVFARLPGQIEWIDWDAVTAETGAWIKRHEPERLGLRGVNDLPHIDAHGAIDHL